MKLKDRHIITLSNGREIGAHSGFISISSELEVAVGYDQELVEFNEPGEALADMTKAEKVELCEIAIKRWQELKRRIEAEKMTTKTRTKKFVFDTPIIIKGGETFGNGASLNVSYVISTKDGLKIKEIKIMQKPTNDTR